jgi:hypothetical protein
MVQVRNYGLNGSLDGKLIQELEDPHGDLNAHTLLRPRKELILGVRSDLSPTTILKMELVEVTGEGMRTR